jgi:flagellin-like hook-associated protein FlgL
VTTPAADFTAGVQQSLAAGQNAASDAQAARADLGAVNTILDEIDARISGQGTVSVDELSLIESALKELGSRAGRFAPPAR